MADFANTPLALPAKGMNLEQTLFCGQSFSWQRREDGCFAGVAAGHPLLLRQQGDTLLLTLPGGGSFTAEELAFWRHYFALDADYAALQARFSKHKKLAACVACFPGIRVLRQPFFETLLAFIISQNNHIPRITGIVQRLCAGFGRQLAPGLYDFPTPQQLAGLTPQALAPLRAGFRAGYLIDAAQKVAQGVVREDELRGLDNAQAREVLMRIKGVGPKVADCVLLFALEREDVAPMDVWMKRAMTSLFPRGMPAACKGKEGIAQQYIFFWAREHLPPSGK